MVNNLVFYLFVVIEGHFLLSSVTKRRKWHAILASLDIMAKVKIYLDQYYSKILLTSITDGDVTSICKFTLKVTDEISVI